MIDNDLVGRDLRPLKNLSDDDVAWLQRLQKRVNTGDLVVALGETRDEDMSVVWCAEDGTWWTGRYVGVIAFEDRRLRVLPRLGLPVLAHWLAAANRLTITPTAAGLEDDELFLPALLAHVWAQTVVRAARHGQPYLRVESRHQGHYIRGRLDVRGTARLLQRRRHEVVSRDRERTLKHDLSQVIIAAEHSLNQALGGASWINHNLRAKDVLAPLRGAVGARPRLPSRHDLNRIRYTPIRQPWEAVAELSYRIATSRGLIPTADRDDASGILIDVAELWELFVLEALRRGLPHHTVRHGTRELDTRAAYLLTSETQPDRGMGRLLPDYIIEDPDGPLYVLDAKYKALASSRQHPNGVQREDLYQLAAYMSRFDRVAGRHLYGALIYPRWDEEGTSPPAVAHGPWRTPAGGRATFLTCPTHVTEAAEYLRSVVADSSQLLDAGVRVRRASVQG